MLTVARLRDEGKTVVSIGWGNPSDGGMETIVRDGREIEVPRYDKGRRDVLEGEADAAGGDD